MIGKEIGPYKILEKIGQGGMGTVYKGIHRRLEQEVAIKVLASEYACDPSIRQRFIAEAKMQAQLTHPHVVNVINGLEEGHDVFLVMEYVKGETLEQRLARLGYLPQQEAVLIGRDVLAALDFMHSKAIIHRDIKPSNIMFTATDVVKVADFGIAKMAGDSMLTRTGMSLGTLCYMSPEEIQNKPVSVASDMYALGMTLYRMVTGRLPFPSDSEYSIVKGHIEQAPVPPWVINDQVSQALGQIILKALEKIPARRYCGAQDFAQALTAFLQKPDDAARASSGVRRSPGKRRSLWSSVALVAGGSMALGLLVYFVLFHPLPASLPTMSAFGVSHSSSPVPVTEQTQEPPPAVISQPSASHSPAVPSVPQPVDVLPPVLAPRQEYRSSRDDDPEVQAPRAENTATIPPQPRNRGKQKAPMTKESPTGWRIEKSDGRIVR